jgi:hypothetical protein
MVLTETSTLQLSFYSDRLIVSKEPIIAGSATFKKKEIMLRNRSTVYNGFMSPSTKRKVRTILTTWINAVNYENQQRDIALMKPQRKLTFVTLTLSEAQKHDDNWIKRNMLNRFLIKLKRQYNVEYYFWRAEKQKNGRIHFHLMVDAYIDKRDLQTEWNDIQQSTGYLDEFFLKNRRYNAPSTHIKSVPKDLSVIDYVLKYVTKNPDDIEDAELQVHGRIWGCSKELRDLKPYSSGEINEIGEHLAQLVESKKVELLDHDHFQIYFLDTEAFLKKHHQRTYADMIQYYEDIYKSLYYPFDIQGCNIQPQEEISREKISKHTQLSLFGDMYLSDNELRVRRERMNH